MTILHTDVMAKGFLARFFQAGRGPNPDDHMEHARQMRVEADGQANADTYEALIQLAKTHEAIARAARAMADGHTAEASSHLEAATKLYLYAQELNLDAVMPHHEDVRKPLDLLCDQLPNPDELHSLLEADSTQASDALIQLASAHHHAARRIESHPSLPLPERADEKTAREAICEAHTHAAHAATAMHKHDTVTAGSHFIQAQDALKRARRRDARVAEAHSGQLEQTFSELRRVGLHSH